MDPGDEGDEGSVSSAATEDQHPNTHRAPITIRFPLSKMIRDPNDLTTYVALVQIINRVVTASYLFAKFVFLNEYNDNDEFNANEFINQAFFVEILKSMQGRRRNNVSNQKCLRHRRLVDRYLNEFCVAYQYTKVLAGRRLGSWEDYVGTEMLTAYTNSAQKHTTTYFRRIVNQLLGHKGSIQCLRKSTATAAEKAASRAHLNRISLFPRNLKLVCFM